jgi:hypothetical protein
LPGDLIPIEQTLGDFAELSGYRAGTLAPGQPLSVALYWRAQHETTVSYKSFVHLLDAEGAIIVQSDAIPANWTRLTTGWLPQEVIEDAHTLHTPQELVSSPYRLAFGCYDPQTGHRATTPDGQERIVVALPQATP